MAVSKIAVVGTGNVGTTLGSRLLQSGRQVKYGARDPASDKAKALMQQQPGATVDAVPAAVEWAEVVILATPSWDPSQAEAQVQALAASLGPGVKGKVLVDLVNGVSGWPKLCLPWDGSTSSSELLQAALPETAVFKAFNTVGLEHLGVPDGSRIDGRQLTMLFAGGPPDSKVAVADVVAAVGFKPKYVGPIRYARNLDAIAELWIHLSIPGCGEGAEDWGRDFHFQVVDKE